MKCYYCEMPIERHSARETKLCLEQVCRLVREKGGLPFDDVDSSRHPTNIVESCIKDN